MNSCLLVGLRGDGECTLDRRAGVVTETRSAQGLHQAGSLLGWIGWLMLNGGRSRRDGNLADICWRDIVGCAAKREFAGWRRIALSRCVRNVDVETIDDLRGDEGHNHVLCLLRDAIPVQEGRNLIVRETTFLILNRQRQQFLLTILNGHRECGRCGRQRCRCCVR